MMMVDKINLNHLRVFEAVYRSCSMTAAAKELHLTQSGISQHIMALEETLNIVLFDRFKQKLVPTGVAKVLFDKCSKGFYELEKTLWQITDKEKELHGYVKLGMPSEFGNNLIIPIVSEFLKKHGGVKVEFHFALAPKVSAMLLNGELDYGYVDEYQLDKRLTVRKASTEIHELVCTHKYLKAKDKVEHKRAYYESLDYIAYQDAEPVVRKWFLYHLKNSEDLSLNVRAYAQSPYAVLQLILNDVGVGILPRHIVTNFSRSSQNLFSFPGSGKELTEEISVAYLTGRTHTRAAVALSDYIDEQLKKL